MKWDEPCELNSQRRNKKANLAEMFLDAGWYFQRNVTNIGTAAYSIQKVTTASFKEKSECIRLSNLLKSGQARKVISLELLKTHASGKA